MPSSDQMASDLEPERVAEARRERERPRRVDAAAERREDAEPPVADLVAEALDHDPPVGRQRPDDLAFVVQVGEQVGGRALVEVVLARAAARGLRVVERDELARRAPDRLAELERPADALALPERHRPGTPGRRRDEHAVAGDLLDPPRRGAEQERLALAGLVDHLLVELADPAAALDLEDAEEAAVGDRAGVRDGERRAPVRPRIVPATRSQTMRGRSSANSSDG